MNNDYCFGFFCDQLFKQLEESSNASVAFGIEMKIWKILQVQIHGQMIFLVNKLQIIGYILSSQDIYYH